MRRSSFAPHRDVCGAATLAALLAGCQAPAPPIERDARPADARPALDRPGVQPGEQPGARPGAGATPATAQKQRASIDVVRPTWPSAVDEGALASLPEPQRARLAASPVPVLVPRDAALLANAELVVKPTFFALATKTADRTLTVSLSATTVVHQRPGLPRAEGDQRVRGDRPAWITENEAIRSVTWSENGVSYVLELECSAPATDARCADDSALRALAESLVYVGGRGPSHPEAAR
jgi:hypothetical protein